MKSRPVLWILLFATALLTIGAICNSQPRTVRPVALKLAPKSALPEFAQNAPEPVQEAYRYAIANPEPLQAIPCYCCCRAMNHEHNLACYIKNVGPDGTIEFDNHAYGCQICVDITQDVMRLSRQGEDLKAIRTYVDAEYKKFGPPTNTAPIR